MGIYFHIDINAFFASVAEILDNNLLDKPIVVSTSYSRHAIISTANYNARKFGIKSAMPLYIAKQLCPNLIIVEHQFKQYNIFHDNFISIIKKYSNNIEIASIDECYLFFNQEMAKNSLIHLAKKIQNDILCSLKLKTSIGIANTKFLAKMASDLKKPLGISTIFIEELATKLWPIKIDDMYMVGKSLSLKLKNNGITTIGNLAHASPDVLNNIIGSKWEWYYNNANGFYTDICSLPISQKSFSYQSTFEYATSDYTEVSNAIKNMALVISKKTNGQTNFSNISMTVKNSDKKTCSHSFSLSTDSMDYEQIVFYALKIYDQFFSNSSISKITLSLCTKK